MMRKRKNLAVRWLLLGLALLPWMSASAGIPVSAHWCGGQVAQLRIYSMAQSCSGMDFSAPETPMVGAIPCCIDILEWVQHQDPALGALSYSSLAQDTFAGLGGPVFATLLPAPHFLVHLHDRGPPRGSLAVQHRSGSAQPERILHASFQV